MNDIELAKAEITASRDLTSFTKLTAIQALQEKAEQDEWDKAIKEEYGECTTVYHIVKFFIDYLQGKQEEPLSGFRILTNQDKSDYEQWKTERENPKPLMFEELEKRIGKPVWIKHIPSPCTTEDGGTWEILKACNPTTEHPYIEFEKIELCAYYYAQGWLAYDHEPKKSTEKPTCDTCKHNYPDYDITMREEVVALGMINTSQRRILMIDKIIERLEKEKAIAFLTLANTGDEKFDFAYLKVGNYADKAINIVKQAAEEGDWTKCSDRLPEKDGRYEVTIKSSKGYLHTEMCNFHKTAKDKQWGCGMTPVNVIAWRSRPEPYKEN